MIIDHVLLAMPVGGESDARSFYIGLLGMVEEPRPAALAARGGCWFRRGSCVVHVGVDPEFVPQKKGHPAFVVLQLSELATRLEAAGHEVRWDSAIPDVSRLFTDDPFGNRVEFIEEGQGLSQGGYLESRP